MRLFIWLWDTLKNLFAKKSETIPTPTLVELKPAAPSQHDDPMECLEGFIDVTLTV
jgi:hypothetical protein